MCKTPGSKLWLLTVIALPVCAQSLSNVPAEYKDIYSNMETQIGAFEATAGSNWSQPKYPVNWAPHLSTAESAQYLSLLQPNYYSQTVLTELLEIEATGAKAVTEHVDFPILYQPFYTYSNTPSDYLRFVAFYRQLVSDVHARGMKIVMEATVQEPLDGTGGASAFGPYYQTLTWTEFMRGRTQNDVDIAQLLQPDYLSLICEPDSEANNGYQPTEDSPSGALQLLETILAGLQNAGVANVNIGAGAGTWIPGFTTYISEFSAVAPLDYVDMHVYPVNRDYLTNVLAGAAIVKASGKSIGVSEAWPDKEANSELGTLSASTIDSRDVFSFWAPIDTAFLHAMTDCAQYEKFAFFSPSYPPYFANYLDYGAYGSETPAELLPAAFLAASTANQAGAFTSTGTAFSTMIAGTDTTPPSTPSAPTASSVSGIGVTLTWVPATDNVGVAGYNIYRNAVIVSRIAAPPYHDTGLAPGLTYAYSLSAFDAQGNVSGQSPVLDVTTINTIPPTVPADLTVTAVTGNSVSLSWAPSTDPGGMGGYRVLRGSSASSLQIIAANVPVTSYLDAHLAASTTYYYAVEAFNSVGLSSGPGPAITAKTQAK
jgi:chitodextrinase